MIEAPDTCWEAEDPEVGVTQRLTAEQAERLISDGLVYIVRTTHTLHVLPGQNYDLSAPIA